MSLSLITQSFSCEIFLATSWHDPRLLLPPIEGDGHRVLPPEVLDVVWKPIVYFKNAKRVERESMSRLNQYVWLFGNGTILHVAR